MALPLTCEVCGFRWDDLVPEEVPRRLNDAVASFREVVLGAGPLAHTRPSPQRWSILEYGSHLRDVMISIRERIVSACIIDDWISTPIHREERVELGFYALDTPIDVVDELGMASRLLVKSFLALSKGQLTRQFTYGLDNPSRVTTLWAGAQSVHEAEHHLADVVENLAVLRSRTTN